MDQYYLESFKKRKYFKFFEKNKKVQFWSTFRIKSQNYTKLPKDSQFSVPIRTPVRVLVGREAPGKFPYYKGPL